MLAFVRAWGAALLLGESLAGTIGKVLTLMALIIGATVLESPIQITVWLPAWAVGLESEWSLGWLAVAVIGVVYVAWTGGVAWVRSRGPTLAVDPDLIADGDHGRLRLRVRNGGQGLLSPNAALVWIEDEFGACQAPILPLNLRWSHLPIGERPRLSWDESATVDVASTWDRHTVAWRVRFEGEHHAPEEHVQPAQRHPRQLRFCVRVTVPGTKNFQERAFRLVADEAHALGLRAIRLREREASHRRAFRWATGARPRIAV